jgi:tetratricopeptide (TPR) repeat protein
LKIGQMFEKMRDFDEAIATYKKALRRDKNNF